MWTKPLVEIRREEYERGTLPRLISLYQDNGLPVLARHIGRPLAFYVTLVLTNSLIQIWGYDSMADFEKGRVSVEDDPDWNDFERGRKDSYAIGRIA